MGRESKNLKIEYISQDVFQSNFFQCGTGATEQILFIGDMASVTDCSKTRQQLKMLPPGLKVAPFHCDNILSVTGLIIDGY